MLPVNKSMWSWENSYADSFSSLRFTIRARPTHPGMCRPLGMRDVILTSQFVTLESGVDDDDNYVTSSSSVVFLPRTFIFLCHILWHCIFVPMLGWLSSILKSFYGWIDDVLPAAKIIFSEDKCHQTKTTWAIWFHQRNASHYKYMLIIHINFHMEEEGYYTRFCAFT